MDLWAEYFLIGTFIHLLSDAANIELAVSTDHLLYCLIPAAFHFLLLRSDNRGITPKWDNIFGNSATADSTRQHSHIYHSTSCTYSGTLSYGQPKKVAFYGIADALFAKSQIYVCVHPKCVLQTVLLTTFTYLSQYIMQLQWNPVLWTTLKSGLLWCCRHFVWSQMHLHMFAYNQNVEIPAFHKVDSSPSPNST